MTERVLTFLYSWLLSVWEIIYLSAPWLLVGFFVAGLLHVLLPKDLVERHLKKPGVLSVVKASLFGIPLPLCSCSVIPVGTSLRRSGASRGATASFFISTPEIGVDSFLLSYALLGPVIAFSRVLVAIASALGAGVLIDFFSSEPKRLSKNISDNTSSCCSHTKEPKSCCDSGGDDLASGGLLSKLGEAIRFGCNDLAKDLGRLLVIGFFAAALVSVLVPDTLWDQANIHPITAMFLMLVASLPLYVCATSSTPLAAALLMKGVPPGAVLVFLLAGPATNLATMIVLRRELGTLALSYYLFSVVFSALLAGYLVEIFYSSIEVGTEVLEHAGHHHAGPSPVEFGCGILLIFILSQAFLPTRRNSK